MYEIVVGRGESDKKKYGLDGTIFLGKHYVKMGQTTSLSNQVHLDMNRSHVVFVCGKRGSGKCLTGNTLITLENGEIIPIKDLEKKKKEILSLNKELKINSKPWSEFFKRTVNTILKIKLRTGKEIELTPEHPLLTVKGWEPAQNLIIGSRIATPRIENVFGEEPVPEHEIKLLAYLLAEGHMKDRYVLFSNKDHLIIEDFIYSVKKYHPLYEVKEHGKPGCYAIRGRQPVREVIKINRDSEGRFSKGTKIDNRSIIRRWLDELGIHNRLAKQRQVPKNIFTLPKHQLSLFLNRLFSCDGSIVKKRKQYWEISYSSASEDFIKSISHLLLRFGIVSRTRKKYAKRFDSYSYEISINGEFVYTYLQEIGFFGKKEKRAKQAIKDCFKIKRNTNVDTIPKEIWESYRPENWARIGRSMGYKYPKALRESIRYSPSRQKLLQIAVADKSDTMQMLAESDIFWDEIVSIEKIEGEFPVYDICVPETHNFIANDIIVHNSYTLGVLAEGLADMPPAVRKNVSIILLDTMGIYWTMKYPNKQDRELLKEWNLEPKALNINIYAPKGYYQQAKDKGIPVDSSFSLSVQELDAHDWQMTFDIKDTSEAGVLIEKVISELQDSEESYDIDAILERVENDNEASQVVKSSLKNRLIAAKGWGIFDKEGTSISELAKPGQVTVLDVSAYATMPGSWNIKSLVIGLISEKLFIQRMTARKEEEFESVHNQVQYYEDEQKTKSPLVWLVIDEAHEFLPEKGKTLATEPLVTILREGRQPGISLVLASQQPGKIHTDVLTQADTVICHRITAKIDIDALGTLMQSYMRASLDKFIDNLPRESGAAIVLDDNNEKMYPIRVRPRFTWHGGSAPVAMPGKEKDIVL